MKQTQKKTLTLNKIKVSMFRNNAVNSKNGNNKFWSVVDTTGSLNCVPTITN